MRTRVADPSRRVGPHRGMSVTRQGLDEEKDINTEMRTSTGAARRSAPRTDLVPQGQETQALLQLVLATLDDGKAENIVTIDLDGKSSIGDYMVVASGRTDRHVNALADQLQRKLKEKGHGRVRVEGEKQGDWVLVDVGDIIVHLFQPEVREFYNLEKMWSQARPPEPSH